MQHTNEKGIIMISTEYSSKAPYSTGFFAMLGAGRGVRGIGGLLCVLVALGVLAVTPGVAFANSAEGFSHALGIGKGEGAEELNLVAPPAVSAAPYYEIAGSGVAVDNETHDVYVADTGNRRVDEFEAGGKFVRAWGWGVADGLAKFETCGPGAFPTPTLTCQAGLAGPEPGELEAPKFIAVDNSGGPSQGDVYVGTGVGKEAVNEKQLIAMLNAPEGKYTLMFEGHTTKEITFTQGEEKRGDELHGEDAEAAREALEELPGIGKGNVNVYESVDAHGQPLSLDVEFVGALKETAVPQLTADAIALKPSDAKIVVSTERVGSTFADELVSKFTSDGELVESWGIKGQLDGSTAAKGPFGGALYGIAVDSAGDLWVHSNQTQMYEFDENGEFKQNLELKYCSKVECEGLGDSASGIAVDGAGYLYAVGRGDELAEFNPGGELIGPVSVGHDTDPTGFALDTATGDVYADLGSSIEQADFECVPLNDCETFGSPELQGGAGVAVDSSVGDSPVSGTVYAANIVKDQVDAMGVLVEAETLPASGITATGMTFNGTVNPEGSQISECYFEYGTNDAYEEQLVPCVETRSEIGSGTSAVSVHAPVKSLRGSTTYHFRLVAKKAGASAVGNGLETPTSTVPLVAGAEALDVTAGGARLQATVNPDGLKVKHCEFEYGTSTSYGNSVRCEPPASLIGSGTEPVSVGVSISGLVPNMTYHWRLSVSNENGEAFAVDHTFGYDTMGSVLPDNRAYEMVTPPFKNGALIGHTFDEKPRYEIAEDGSNVMAASIQCFAGSESCTAARELTEGEPYDFTRTPTGWVTTALAPPATVFSVNSYWTLGANDGTELFSTPSGPEGLEEWYARDPGGSFVDLGPMAFSGKNNIERVKKYIETADLSHLVWEYSGDGALNRVEKWPFDNTEGGRDNITSYEYVGTGNREPFLVGVTGGRDSTGLVSNCETNTDAMSTDGRTVLFTAAPCSSGSGANADIPVPAYELYARIDGELPDAHTVAISRPECEDAECRESEAQPSEAYFDGASEDGSRVFFLDAQQLTDQAIQGTGEANACGSTSECNLYMYDLAEPEGHGLSDVSETHTGVREDPRVQGVVATSPDGSHVYFVAKGVLSSAPNKLGQRARAGLDNLYVYERDGVYPEGRLVFITILPTSDQGMDWGGSQNLRTANVTPDGRFLVFESSGDLTPDDTRTDGSTQIFRYDAVTEELVRISIGNGGFNDNGNAGVGDATIVGPPIIPAPGPMRGDPTMSNDGAYVFFQSPVGLTPQALNDVVIASITGVVYAQNVYEYHEGHVYLISDGRDVGTAFTPCEGREGSGSAVCLLGADGTGANVFFTTADQLVPADTDTQVDIYDARICEPENGNPCIAPAPPPLPPCLGESCHGTPAATPSLPSPGTVSFNGEGNIAPVSARPTVVKTKSLTEAQKLAAALKTCKKKTKSKRAVCEKQARKKYRAVKAKKSAKGKK
jgi:hypothetical protein